MQCTQAAANADPSNSAIPEDSSGQSASRRQFFRVGGLFAAGWPLPARWRR
ncbi:MAG: hypothetical protein PHO64_00025 [Thiomonas sp.]|nr:hypothetical protein [Thiomonas sp.]